MSYIIDNSSLTSDHPEGIAVENRMLFLRRTAKNLLAKILFSLRLYPHIFFTFMPFKIHEFRELLKGTKLARSDKILDLGCGGGLQSLILAGRCESIVGIDVDSAAIARARRNAAMVRGRISAEFHCARLEDAGFKAQSFDKIFSFCVLEHIANYAEVLHEAHRILKTGGWFIFSVDSLESITEKAALEKHQREHSVVKYFRPGELEALLQAIGFRKIQIYPLFSSRFAQKLFLRGLNQQFKFGRLRALLDYFFLAFVEKYHPGDKGIFFAIKCCK